VTSESSILCFVAAALIRSVNSYASIRVTFLRRTVGKAKTPQTTQSSIELQHHAHQNQIRETRQTNESQANVGKTTSPATRARIKQAETTTTRQDQ
jgi:hypothetical protein